MARIISEREHKSGTDYFLEFPILDLEGSWYSFECNADGVVDIESMPEVRRDNYHKCINGEHSVGPGKVNGYPWQYTEPAILECDCGCEVRLERFTNTCDKCNADYNTAGQRLAPREQWGEETGEHWTECY